MKHLQALMILFVFCSTALAENLIKNGNFEQNYKNKSAKYWAQLGSKGIGHKGVDDVNSKDGKYSYKLSNCPSRKYLAITQSIKGFNKVSDIKKSLKISVWIKTDSITKKPYEGAGEFCFWTHNKGHRNSGSIAIASVRGTTGWTQYTKTITLKDLRRLIGRKQGDKKPFTWTLRANLFNQPGSMWIDKVECEWVEEKPLICKLDAPEYTIDRKNAFLNITVKDFINNKIKLVITGKSNNKLFQKQIVLNKLNTKVEIDISKLKAGTFTLTASLIDKTGKIIIAEKINFKKISGPSFDF